MVCNYSNTIAIKHGINAALIAGYINSCIENKETYKDENTPWIRITYKSITAVFPFMSIGTAQYTIQKLNKANPRWKKWTQGKRERSLLLLLSVQF